jgi:hypothetical protein
MFISDPRILTFIYPASWIPDPTTVTTGEGEKNLLSYLFFVAEDITKLKIILSLNRRRKTFEPLH